MQSPTPMSTPQPIFVFRFNHFDPTWRRGWDRDFHDAGRRFVSYRAIEERWITDAIATCADGVGCFMVECSWVLRHYLEQHPEQLAALRQLTREGRFELLGSGENIVDANLIHGETLARNLMLGTRWAVDTLGARPTTGWHSDGFGSCAQMPQVFRQCGYRWLPAISYNTPDAPYWRGLDGSTLFFSDSARPQGGAPFSQGERLVHRLAVGPHVYFKLPPCPACQGKGCPDCGGDGFQAGPRAEFEPACSTPLPGAVGVLLLWGEEILPGQQVATDIAGYNAAHPEVTVRQGTYRDLEPYIADFLEAVDYPPAGQISSKVENNPVHSGCYVSRIKIKQQHRACEHALLAAECWDALLNAGAAHPRLRDAWRNMTLSAFHDAITSSHCDPAYAELCDLHREVGDTAAEAAAAAHRRVLAPRPGTVTVFNHHSFAASAPVTVTVPGRWQGAGATADGADLPIYQVAPVAGGTAVTFLAPLVPALGARTVCLAETPPPVAAAVAGEIVQHGPFAVCVGAHGIAGVDAEGFAGAVNSDRFLFGELILEHDIGDPWATRSLDRTRERLSPYTRLESVTRQGGEVAIRYVGRHPSCDDPHRTADPQTTYLTWSQVFRLREGLPWLEVETHVRWYTHSRRLRLAFPSATDANRGVYDVPYGVLERDRYEGTSTAGGNAGGDWPALHWAGIQTPAGTFAVFNQGTPSARVEDGAVLYSVLRSPQIPYCLLDPDSYVAHNYDGMRDHGDHVFRHALYLAPDHWRRNDVIRQAALFNSGLAAIPGMLAGAGPEWRVEAAHTMLTALKTAEDGRGIVLRFVECAGAPDTVRLTPPPAFRAAGVCTLMEEAPTPLPAQDGVWTIPLEPWKIATVRLFTSRAETP